MAILRAVPTNIAFFVEFATPLQKQRKSLAMQSFSRFYDIHLH